MKRQKSLSDLKSKDKLVREKAVDELALAPDKSSVSLLEKILLNDPEGSVRRRAALALGRISDENTCDSLYKAMIKDHDFDTKRNAAISLGKFGDIRAIIPLYEIYQMEKKNNFFDSLDRARVKLVLTEIAQKKAFSTIEELVNWVKQKK